MEVYLYRADLYCADCGEIIKIERKEYEPGHLDAFDSDYYPKGPYSNGGGEADTPQHCAECGVFLDNPLTGDGETYVRDAWREFVETGRGDIVILTEWKLRYDWVWDAFESVTFADMVDDGNVSDLMQRRYDQLSG